MRAPRSDSQKCLRDDVNSGEVSGMATQIVGARCVLFSVCISNSGILEVRNRIVMGRVRQFF